MKPFILLVLFITIEKEAAMVAILAVILIFGLPIVIVIAAVYYILNNRRMAHAERLKMIENGLITDASDFDKMSKLINTSSGLDKFSLAFYPLLVLQGLIFITYFISMLFFLVFLKTAEQSGLFLIFSLAGIMATILFTVFIRIYHKFRQYRAMLLAGCFFLSLMWTVLLINHLKDLSIDSIKTGIKQNLELGIGGVNVADTLNIEENKARLVDSMKSKGRLIVR